MATDKFIRQVNGTFTETLPATTSVGASSAGKIIALDNTGKIDASMMPVGIGADTASLIASEDLSAGDFINVFNDTGVAKVRKADASMQGKEAHGFVLTAVLRDDNAEVYFEGTNTQVTGATPGVIFLSASTPGQATSTPPSASGNIVQKIGVCVSPTAINVEFAQAIVLA